MNERNGYWLKKVFFAVIAMLSMSTSFGFFVLAFEVNNHWGVVLATGLVGVIVTDGATLAWLRIYLNGSDNNDERVFAAWGIGVGVIGSVVASFAYLLGTSTLVEFPPAVASWSTIAIACIIVAHFLLVVMSNYRATSAQVDERMAGLMSEATGEMLGLTEQRFRQAIPGLAARNADRLTWQLAAKFALASDGIEAQQPPALPAQLPDVVGRPIGFAMPTTMDRKAFEAWARANPDHAKQVMDFLAGPMSNAGQTSK